MIRKEKRVLQKVNTEISTSKSKLFRLLVASVAFVTIGLWQIITPRTDSAFPIFSNRLIIITIGVLSVLFFGLATVIFLLKLFGFKYKRLGLKIDETGITDNSYPGSIGFVPWRDIKEVKISELLTKKFLTIIVYNPDDYINKQRTLAKMKGMKADLKMTGSPINISAATLKISVEDLKVQMDVKLNEYRDKLTK